MHKLKSREECQSLLSVKIYLDSLMYQLCQYFHLYLHSLSPIIRITVDSKAEVANFKQKKKSKANASDLGTKQEIWRRDSYLIL